MASLEGEKPGKICHPEAKYPTVQICHYPDLINKRFKNNGIVDKLDEVLRGHWPADVSLAETPTHDTRKMHFTVEGFPGIMAAIGGGVATEECLVNGRRVPKQIALPDATRTGGNMYIVEPSVTRKVQLDEPLRGISEERVRAIGRRYLLLETVFNQEEIERYFPVIVSGGTVNFGGLETGFIMYHMPESIRPSEVTSEHAGLFGTGLIRSAVLLRRMHQVLTHGALRNAVTGKSTNLRYGVVSGDAIISGLGFQVNKGYKENRSADNFVRERKNDLAALLSGQFMAEVAGEMEMDSQFKWIDAAIQSYNAGEEIRSVGNREYKRLLDNYLAYVGSRVPGIRIDMVRASIEGHRWLMETGRLSNIPRISAWLYDHLGGKVTDKVAEKWWT